MRDHKQWTIKYRCYEPPHHRYLFTIFSAMLPMMGNLSV
jgi:hypothetical protein